MLCLDPFVKAGQAFPCGKCLPCLKRRRQLWVHRLMLEKLCHLENAVATLTYADDTLPKDMSLQPAHLQLFLKRLRKAISPRRIRFYGVGEYGDKSERPHYHIVLFGLPSCLRGRSMYSRERTNCCSSCDQIRDIWGYGHVLLDQVSQQSLGYICGYITKNMRRTDDDRLKGRWPEFARMSLRPGLGFAYLDEFSQSLMENNLDREDDVPLALRHGDQIKPLGRYLRGKLRGMLYGEEYKVEYVDEEMLAMWNACVAATPKGGEIRRTMFKNMIVDATEPHAVRMRAKDEIRQSKKRDVL